MLRTSSRTQHAASPPLPRRLLLLFWLVIFGAGLILLPYALTLLQSVAQSPVLSVTQPGTAAASVSLYADDALARDRAIDQLTQIRTPEAANQLLAFFQHDEYFEANGMHTAHALAGIGTPQALRVLVRSLASDVTESRRTAAMSALEEAGSSADGLLISALDDADPGVRENAARLLGYRRSGQSGTALLAATYDLQPAVREAAAWALSEVAGVQALPRLEQMSLLDADTDVRQAAEPLSQRIYSRVSAGIEADVRALTVASTGRAYAATDDALWVLHEKTWQPVTALPAPATALAVADDGRTLYIGTLTGGLLRSDDGGQRLLAVRALPPGAGVTALCVNPLDTRQVFVALAGRSGTGGTDSQPRGVFYSPDDGATWSALAGAPQDQLTVHLLIDPSAPRYLFGATLDHAWRANLS